MIYIIAFVAGILVAAIGPHWLTLTLIGFLLGMGFIEFLRGVASKS